VLRRVVLGWSRLGRRHKIRQEPVDNVQRLRGGLLVARQRRRSPRRRRSTCSPVPRGGACAGAARVHLGREQGDAEHAGRPSRARACACARGAVRCRSLGTSAAKFAPALAGYLQGTCCTGMPLVAKSLWGPTRSLQMRLPRQRCTQTPAACGRAAETNSTKLSLYLPQRSPVSPLHVLSAPSPLAPAAMSGARNSGNPNIGRLVVAGGNAPGPLRTRRSGTAVPGR